MRTLSALTMFAALPAQGQSLASPPSNIPPNAIDRATTRSDARSTAVNTAMLADRRDAQIEARDRASQIGPLTGSTMTDGPRGLGAGSAPLSPAAPPPR